MKFKKLLIFSFLLSFSFSILAQDKEKLNLTKSSNREGFLENKGQIIDQNNLPNPAVKYLFNQTGLNVQLKANGFSYDAYVIESQETKHFKSTKLIHSNEKELNNGTKNIHFHRIDIEFIGANPTPQLLAEQPGADYLNYYTTGTPEEGVLGVRHFGKVTYKNLYPGIDLEFIAKPGTSKPVEYNFIVHPGADLSVIKWRYNGANQVVLKNGIMQISTRHGVLNESIPLSFEKETGAKRTIAYKKLDNMCFGFDGNSDKKNTLIIDPLPILNWGSYYGGTVLDELSAISPDPSGNLFVTGETTSTTTIATTGSYQTTYAGGTVQYGWGGDAFIAKLTSSGTRIYGTYFGGTGEDMGWSLKVDKNGDVYVSGDTKSTANIATTGAFQTSMAGSYHDPFLVKFSSSGSRIWGTYFGGTGNDRATRNGMAIDASGNVYITGTNNTANDMWITTVGAYQRTNLSTSAYDEPFVAKFSPTGTLIWGTYYGGTLHDQGIAIALDKSNNVYITGNVTSTSLIATTGAYQTALAGGQDAFIAKLNSTGSALLWATYYGGSGTDIGNSIAVDNNGDVYISGYTTSTAGIASTGAYLTTYQGGSYDGFLAKFSSTGTRLWGTYTGGAGYDLPRSMAITPSGDIMITGHTASTSGIATSDGLRTTYIGGTYDGYISKFSPSGAYKLGTYFGGNLEDIPWYIEMDAKSNIFIVGRTTSTAGISTSGVYQTTFGGGTYDGFIYKFQDLVADLSIESLSITPNPVCSNQPADVVVKTKNNGPIPAMQLVLGLDQVGQARITHTIILNSLDIGKDTTVTIKGLFKSNIPGTAVTITGINLSTDLNSLNDTAKISMDIQASPSGSSLIKGSPFTSPQSLTTGTLNNPDIVAEKDTLTYEITSPKNLNNKDYGNTWRVAAVNLITQGGRILPSKYYNLIGGSIIANTKVKFLPDLSLTDTSITLNVVLQVMSGRFCDSTITRSIFVAPRVLTDFNFNTVCDGDNVVFTNTSTISSGNFTSKWDFGTGNPGDTSTNTSAVFTFPSHGTYNVKLTTTSSPYGYVTSKTISVVVNEMPAIGFKVFNACFGDSLSFVNSTTISKGSIVYAWDLGNGTTSKKVNPKQKYAVAGSYKVTLTATSNGCKQSLTKNAWQFARPVAGFSTPSNLCDKTDIQIMNASTISMGSLGYRWTFSDGGISTATQPIHNFSSSGAHTIKMKAISEFGCADSITKTVVLAEAPIADFTNEPACNQSNIDFKFTGFTPGNGIVTVFNWDFAGEGNSTLENPSKHLPNIGSKVIKLTLTSNNGCKDIISKTIQVKQQSKANFEATDVCDGEPVVFTNKSTVSSGNLAYKWKFGDGQTSLSHSPRHKYQGFSGTFNVTLVALVAGGCSDSITKAIAINATPSSNFTFTTSGRLVNFKASQAGNTTYYWSFGDGGKAETMNAQYHYLNSFEYGKFTACLFVENAAGCFSQSCQEINISGSVADLSKASGIKVYPNPNLGSFKVSVAEPKSDLMFEIFNSVGKSIKTSKGNSLQTDYSFDLQAAAGVYILRVTNNGTSSLQKITVNK